jgi:hypothetical protein
MRSKPPRVTAKPNIRRLSEKGNVRKEFFEPAEFEVVVNALAATGSWTTGAPGRRPARQGGSRIEW